MAKKLQVGNSAPDFELPSKSGEIVRLSDFKDKKAVVLYFYPKDNTPGCTKEACAFRDSYEVFKEAGAEVIGVSSDSEESHTNFALKHGLPFILLSDKDGKVREQYGATSIGGLPGRVTFVIDRKGVISHIFSSQLNVNKHVDEALNILKLIQ